MPGRMICFHVAEDGVERLALAAAASTGQPWRIVSRLDLRRHGILLDPLQVIGDPLDQLAARPGGIPLPSSFVLKPQWDRPPCSPDCHPRGNCVRA